MEIPPKIYCIDLKSCCVFQVHCKKKKGYLSENMLNMGKFYVMYF